MGDPNENYDSDYEKDIRKDSSSNSGRDISKWIKDLTALAGLIAVLVGAWVSVRSLQNKAETDNATAQVQLRAAELQASQHTADLEQQRKFHDADLLHQDATAKSQDAKDRTQRLESVITQMLRDKESSEGNIAVLFEFINDPTNSKTANGNDDVAIQNAIFARLENPRSREEVDMGFRILDQIGGLSSLALVVELNRDARKRYDIALEQRFAHAEKVHGAAAGAPEERYGQTTEDEKEASRGNTLDPGYDFATINRMLEEEGRHGSAVIETDADFSVQQELSADVIRMSNRSLANYSRLHSSLPQHLDLSGCYLLPTTIISSQYIEGAYLANVPRGISLSFFSDSLSSEFEIVGDEGNFSFHNLQPDLFAAQGGGAALPGFPNLKYPNGFPDVVEASQHEKCSAGAPIACHFQLGTRLSH